MNTNDKNQKTIQILNEMDKAQTLLHLKSPHEALDGLLKLIKQNKVNQNEFKENKIEPELLPIYYLIGESYIKMNKVQKAKDFLIAAYWNTLKTQDNFEEKENFENNIKDEEIQIMRHRAFAYLFQVEGKFDKAIDEIINALIITSKLYGVESYEVAEFQIILGNLHFMISNDKNKKAALLCYQNYVNFWFDIFMSKIQDNKINLQNFLDIKQQFLFSTYKSLIEVSKNLAEFENDQSITMIKLLFIIFVINLNLKNKSEMQKHYTVLEQYMTTFKDLALVKILEEMNLNDYL